MSETHTAKSQVEMIAQVGKYYETKIENPDLSQKGINTPNYKNKNLKIEYRLWGKKKWGKNPKRWVKPSKLV